MEVAVAEDLLVGAQHERVVGGTVELGLERNPELIERDAQRAVDLARAAEAERVLQAPRGIGLGQRAVREQSPQAVRRPPLPGRRPGGHDALVDRAQVRSKPLHRERRRYLRRLEARLAVEQRERRHAR